MEGKNVGSISLKEGQTTKILLNRIARFRIEMINGTVVEGDIPANSEFMVTPVGGDIVSFSINYHDIPDKPFAID